MTRELMCTGMFNKEKGTSKLEILPDYRLKIVGDSDKDYELNKEK